MAAPGKKWIVRGADGRIYGPFEASKIQRLIKQGKLTGEESASEYPVGDWGPMARDPDLYDIILAALSEAGSSTDNPTQITKRTRSKLKPMFKSQTRVQKTSKSKVDDEVTANFPEPEEIESGTATLDFPEEDQAKTRIFSEPGQMPKFKTSPKVIELKDKKVLKRKTGNRLPLVLLILAALLVSIGIILSPFKNRDKKRYVALLQPKISQNQNPKKSDEMTSLGWPYFYKDTVSNYIRAQEYYVEAIEASNKNADAIVMLGLTYLELWPFSKQEAREQAVVQNLQTLISTADPYGSRKAIVSVTVDLILGRYEAAKSQLDSAIASQPGEPRLFALKAQALMDSGDLGQAALYYDRVGSLLPYWVKPPVQLGVIHGRTGNSAEARTYLINALKMNPNHSAARVELGILEAQQFSNLERGKQELIASLEGAEKVLPQVEARGRLALANIFYKENNRSEALKQAERSLQLDSLNPDTRELLRRLGKSANLTEVVSDDRQSLALGEQYMKMGNYLGAQAHFKSAFSSNPKNGRAALRAAQALWELHQAKEAITYLNKAIAADPTLEEAYSALADYLSQRFDFTAALTALEKGAKQRSRSYLIYRGYAQVLFRRGDLAGAEKSAQLALQIYDTDVKTNAIMGQIQLAKKDMLRALQYGKRAVELDGGNPEAQIAYAQTKASYEGIKVGTDYLRKLIDTFPTKLPLRVALAEMLYQDEQFNAALGVLNQVTLADDNNRDAFLLSGDCYFALNNSKDALKSYLSAARVDPSDSRSLTRVGEVYNKLGRNFEAIKQFELALKANPLTPRGHLALGKAYFATGQADLAARELAEEKRINPRSFEAFETTGDLYMTTRNFQGAIREYQQAAERMGPNAGIYIKMARAYRVTGALDVALSMLRQAANRESGVGDIYKEQGLIYENKGMSEQAVDAFNRYLQLEPSAPDRENILNKIKELE